MTIKTGDTVKHLPSGETWTVAYCDGNDLAWCGWPPGLAKTSDCVLVESCSDEESIEMLRRVARIQGDHGYDRRASWARRELERRGLDLGAPDPPPAAPGSEGRLQ